MAERIGRAQIGADFWNLERARCAAPEDVGASFDQEVPRPSRERLNREPGVRGALGRHHAAITHEQVIDVVRAAELVHDRGSGIVAHPRRTDQMSKSRFLRDLARAGWLHHLDHLVLAELDEQLCL